MRPLRNSVAAARFSGEERSFMAGIVVYTYAACDSCRRAVTWLKAHGVSFVERPIRESPPTKAELKRALADRGGELRRLFNTSGQEYRAFGLSERLGSMSVPDALALLAGNGKLVKRPFLSAPDYAVAGFDEETWRRRLVRGPAKG